jgi:hypothetical protein
MEATAPKTIEASAKVGERVGYVANDIAKELGYKDLSYAPTEIRNEIIKISRLKNADKVDQALEVLKSKVKDGVDSTVPSDSNIAMDKEIKVSEKGLELK